MNLDAWCDFANKRYYGLIESTYRKDILRECWATAQGEQRRLCADAYCKLVKCINTYCDDEENGCAAYEAILHAGEEA